MCKYYHRADHLNSSYPDNTQKRPQSMPDESLKQ